MSGIKYNVEIEFTNNTKFLVMGVSNVSTDQYGSFFILSKDGVRNFVACNEVKTLFLSEGEKNVWIK